MAFTTDTLHESPGTQVVVELAPPERLLEVAALAAQAWDVAPDQKALARELAGKGRIALIAVDEPGGDILGVTTATLLEGRRATSDDTVVSREARGRGVGAALMRALVDALRAAGIREVHGQTSERKMDQLGFFLGRGFRVAGMERARGMPWFRDGDLVFRTVLEIS